ncbi:hypothetical protein EON73_02780 [bacterium]|nr:MAG: hypothetical protein EON73_02780 [bacterium]
MPRGRGLDPIAKMNKQASKTLNTMLNGGVKIAKATNKAYKSGSNQTLKNNSNQRALIEKSRMIQQSKNQFYFFYKKGDYTNALINLQIFEPLATLENIDSYYIKWRKDEQFKLYLLLGFIGFLIIVFYLVLS